MSTITTAFEWIKKYFPFILFVVVILLSVLLFSTWNNLKYERKQREFETMQYTQNYNAFTDSITVEYDKKLKAFMFEKENYLVDEIKDLKQYNQDLYKKLDKIKGDLIAAIDANVQGKITDLKADNNLITVDEKKGLYGLEFDSEYKDPGFEQKIEGMSRFYANRDIEKNLWILKPDSTFFDSITTKINITYGFREKDDKYEVFAISSSNKVSFNQLNGVLVLDKCPKKPVPSKRWGLSAYIGPGLNTEFNGNNARFGWSIGIGLTYDIVQWRMPWEKKK